MSRSFGCVCFWFGSRREIVGQRPALGFGLLLRVDVEMALVEDMVGGG